MNKNLFILGAIVLATASQANLLTNADFEGVNYTASGDYQTVVATGTEVTGWNVGGVSVDMVTGGYAHAGTYAIDLAGTPAPGSIFQDIDLAGATSIDFSVDAAFTGDLVNQTLVVSLGSQSQTIIVADGTLTTYNLSFTGLSGGIETLNLATSALNETNGNLFVDNVSAVAAVPEPASMLALGLGAVALIKRRKK